MRSLRFARFGDPSEVLALEDPPIPQPGPGQVLLRMNVRPINPSDLATVQGVYGLLPQLPATPGLEGVGIITALGPGVTGLAAGQRVVPLGISGTWQEYLVCPARALIPVPPDLSDEQAAMLVVNPTTAWLLLREVLRVEPGAWILQNAANSAVGHFVIQLSRLWNFRTINVVRRRDVVDELLAAGADQVICEADEDVVEKVKAITGGSGVRYALDSVAGPSGSRLVGALGRSGTLVVFGAIGGGQPLTILPLPLLFSDLTIRGFWLVNWFQAASPEQIAGLFRQLAALLTAGTLHAPVAARYDLADFKQAVEAARSSTRHGKILLIG